MIKFMILVMITGSMSGCFGKQIRIRSEVQEVHVPLLYCPAPPLVQQPTLPIHLMTQAQRQDDGEVAKHYKASIRVLLGYVNELETALDMYDTTNEAYDELRTKFQGELKKEFEDISVPE